MRSFISRRCCCGCPCCPFTQLVNRNRLINSIMHHHTFFSILSSSIRTCYSVQIWNTDRDFGPQLLFSNVKQRRLARVPCCSWCVEPKALTTIRYQLVNTHFHRSNLQMENALVKHAEARTKHTHRSSEEGSVIWRMSSLIVRVVYKPTTLTKPRPLRLPDDSVSETKDLVLMWTPVDVE